MISSLKRQLEQLNQDGLAREKQSQENLDRLQAERDKLAAQLQQLGGPAAIRNEIETLEKQIAEKTKKLSEYEVKPDDPQAEKVRKLAAQVNLLKDMNKLQERKTKLMSLLSTLTSKELELQNAKNVLKALQDNTTNKQLNIQNLIDAYEAEIKSLKSSGT